ncbi:MAG: Na+/H+ antiporter NhaA [Tannerellaceae bacterium]|nr:Na+/H+ antiporter NhaA [Tannerellaceae bacterium]
MGQNSLLALFRPFRRLSSQKPNANKILFLMTLLAIVIANSPWAAAYQALLDYPVQLHIGHLSLFTHHGEPMTLLEFVNDALMALFFFVIGLEIKQEVLIGELSSVKKAMLPVFAALGGMVFPVLVYVLLCNGSPEIRGAAIPMSTDIAFALAIVTALGKRVPFGLKIFLTALAVVDDLGGIVVIALFYSDGISWMPLFISAAVLVALFAGGRLGIKRTLFYYIGGFIVWMLFVESGIHPTIAGVLVAFTVPARPDIDLEEFTVDMKKYVDMLDFKEVQHTENAAILTSSQIKILNHIHRETNCSISPLQSIADGLHPYIYLFILPVFAFVNAGVTFGGIDLSALMGVPLAIMAGLVIGKSCGIYLFTILFFRLRIVVQPPGFTRRSLFGVSMLGGIGFTVALFISNLAFASLPDVGPELLNQAKLGVFAGSIVSGVLGYLILSKCKESESTEGKQLSSKE